MLLLTASPNRPCSSDAQPPVLVPRTATRADPSHHPGARRVAAVAIFGSDRLDFFCPSWLSSADFVTAVERPAPIQASQRGGGSRSRVLALPPRPPRSSRD